MSFHYTDNKDIETHPLVHNRPESSDSEDDSNEMQVDKKGVPKMPLGHSGEAYDGKTIDDCPYMKIKDK